MKIIKQIKGSLIATSLLLAIVVNPASSIQKASKEDVQQLFLGKRNEIDGQASRALDQDEGSSSREEFYEKVIEKTEAETTAYWSRLIFTGKGMPPDKVMDDAEVIEMVSEDEDLVGYVNPSAVDETVKVILVIP